MKERMSTNDVHKIYSRIILLAGLAHLSFSVLFGILSIYNIMLYNIFSTAFYLCMVVLLKRNRYRFIATCIHAEISFFVAIMAFHFGWESGFSFYLIALCSLIYFSSYRSIYLPYLLAVCEGALFIGLKIYCSFHAPFHPLSASTTLFIYCYNAALCFSIILYAAFLSNLSSLFTMQKLLEKNHKLQRLLDHDELTQLYTRNYIKQKFRMAADEKLCVHLAMADIDNFKYINDTYGHPCGDYVLFTLSTIFKTICSPGTDICRWGGEEFVIVMYDMDAEKVNMCLQKLRESISVYDFHFEGSHFHITMTFGISSTSEQNDFNRLIHLADERMYHGKKTGKNMVISQ